jgi:hypothetical protein
MAEDAKSRRLTPDECRRQASECLRLMRLTADAEQRAMLERMAATWTQMADGKEAKPDAFEL